MPGKPKGLPKTGGRIKGSQNELTKKGKELFYDIVEGQIEHIPNALLELRDTSAKDYMLIIVKLMEYVVPKKAQIELPNIKTINIPLIDWVKNSTDAESQD